MVTRSPTSAGGLAADVVSLATGDIRIPVHTGPDVVRPRAADQAYQSPAGAERLRRAISRAVGQGRVDPEQVLVAPGARLAILAVLAGALAERREVLLPTPYWASYPTLIGAAAGVVAPVPIPAGGAHPTVRALQARLTPATGAVVVNSPRNPDGSTVTMDELRQLLGWTAEHGLLLLFDQVYRGVPGRPPAAPSPLQLGQLPPHCVVVDGLSKSHALAGLRLGWAVATGPVLRRAAAYASHVIGGTSSVAQDVAVSALAESAQTAGRMRPALAANLDYALGRLADIDGVACARPAGGIFLFPDVRGWLAHMGRGVVGAGIADWLRQRHRVAVADGASFGAPGHLRLSFAVPMAELREGLDRLTLAPTRRT